MPQCYISRCYALADVIAISYVIDVITTEEDVISSCLFYEWMLYHLDCMLQHFIYGRCYCQVADGIATGSVLF